MSTRASTANGMSIPASAASDPTATPNSADEEETWDDDFEEILAKWRADPANLEPWFTASIDSEDDTC